MNQSTINVRTLLVSIILVFCISPTYADIWGDLANGLLNGINTAAQMKEKQLVQNVINNPQQHSADMKKFLMFVNTGNDYYSQGLMSDAWGAFYNAKMLAEKTTDRILYLAYAKYGWKSELESIMTVCWNASGSESTYSSGESSNSSGGSTYNSGSSSTTTTCRKCHGRKICTNCNGKGQVFSTTYGVNKYITCPACSGSKVCSLCNGSGK